MATIKSTLFLCKNVDLDPEYNFTIDFDNEDAQKAYFDEKIEHIIPEENYSYIRETERIKVEKNIDDLFGINYLMYENNNKRYYGFITNKEYVNPECTRLTFKLDVFQSYMFDYEIDESFIDREHQDRFNIDGTPLFNLQPENLEIGSEYEITNTKTFNETIENQFFYIIKSKEPLGKRVRTFNSGDTGLPTEYVDDDQDTTSQSGVHDNASLTTNQYLNTGVYVYIVAGRGTPEISLKSDLYQKRATLFALSNKITEDSRVLSISVTKYIPSYVYQTLRQSSPVIVFDKDNTNRAFNGFIAQYDKDTSYHMFRILSYHTNEWTEFNLDDIVNFNGISKDMPANIENETKLHSSPFTLLRLNAYNEFKNFKRENFKSNLKLKIRLSLGVASSTLIYPSLYNGEDINVFEALQLKNPNDITLRTDKWLDYTLNNKASLNGGLVVGGLQTALGIGLGAMTGGIGLAVAGTQTLNFAGQVANEMIKREDIKNQPDDIRPSVNDTNINFNLTYGLIKIDVMKIKQHFRQNVYKYFQHYGYKCNDFKKPDTRSRYYFNYIKTIGVNLKTNIDADVKNEIASIYNNGITIWHFRDADTFKGVNNYDYENAEMSLEV